MTTTTFRSLATVQPKRIGFLWQDRVPLMGLTDLQGDPGQAKSSLVYQLAARLSAGQPMPFTQEVPGPAGVLLLQAEDSLARVVRPTLEAMGADLERVLVAGKLRIPDDLKEIEAAAKEVAAKLIVIDPLTAFLNANINSDACVRRALEPLCELAEAAQLAVLLVRHLRKGTSRNSLYRGAGSIGIAGLARSVLMAGFDPATDDRHQHVLALVKSNVGSAKALRYRTFLRNTGTIDVQWLGEADCLADDLASGPASPEDVSELTRACDVVYTILRDGRQSSRILCLLAARAEVSARTLVRARKKLNVRKVRVGSLCWACELPNDPELMKPWEDRYQAGLWDWVLDHDDTPRETTDRADERTDDETKDHDDENGDAGEAV